MLTFSALQQRVLQWIDEASDTGTTLTLVKAALNASHRRVLLTPALRALTQLPERSVTVTSGQRFTALPQGTAKIQHFWDPNSHVFLPLVPRRQWESLAIDRSNTSDLTAGFDWAGFWPVLAQPSAQTLSLVSSLAGDVSTLAITGLDSSGEELSETITCIGTTSVASAGTYSLITRVTSGGTPTGTRTLSAGSTTLLSLKTTQTNKLYPVIEWSETPSTTRSLLYQAQRIPSTLTSDNDIPDIYPNELAEILVYDTLIDLSTYNTELGLKEQIVWQKRVDEIQRQLADIYDPAIIGSQPRTVRDVDGSARSVAV